MRKKIIAAGVAVVVMAFGFGRLDLAHAAPTRGGERDAASVIQELKDHGYRVVISSLGGGDLDNCTVLSVDRQSPITDAGAARDARDRPTTVPVIARKVAVVALRC